MHIFNFKMLHSFEPFQMSSATKPSKCFSFSNKQHLWVINGRFCKFYFKLMNQSLLFFFGYLTISTVAFQIVHTLIRGLLQEPSDQGLHCLKNSPWKIHQCTTNESIFLKALKCLDITWHSFIQALPRYLDAWPWPDISWSWPQGSLVPSLQNSWGPHASSRAR